LRVLEANGLVEIRVGARAEAFLSTSTSENRQRLSWGTATIAA
jgi:hypothetical protein